MKIYSCYNCAIWHQTYINIDVIMDWLFGNKTNSTDIATLKSEISELNEKIKEQNNQIIEMKKLMNELLPKNDSNTIHEDPKIIYTDTHNILNIIKATKSEKTDALLSELKSFIETCPINDLTLFRTWYLKDNCVPYFNKYWRMTHIFSSQMLPNEIEEFNKMNIIKLADDDVYFSILLSLQDVYNFIDKDKYVDDYLRDLNKLSSNKCYDPTRKPRKASDNFEYESEDKLLENIYDKNSKPISCNNIHDLFFNNILKYVRIGKTSNTESTLKSISGFIIRETIRLVVEKVMDTKGIKTRMPHDANSRILYKDFFEMMDSRDETIGFQ